MEDKVRRQAEPGGGRKVMLGDAAPTIGSTEDLRRRWASIKITRQRQSRASDTKGWIIWRQRLWENAGARCQCLRSTPPMDAEALWYRALKKPVLSSKSQRIPLVAQAAQRSSWQNGRWMQQPSVDGGAANEEASVEVGVNHRAPLEARTPPRRTYARPALRQAPLAWPVCAIGVRDCC